MCVVMVRAKALISVQLRVHDTQAGHFMRYHRAKCPRINLCRVKTAPIVVTSMFTVLTDKYSAAI